jgi:amidase
MSSSSRSRRAFLETLAAGTALALSRRVHAETALVPAPAFPHTELEEATLVQIQARLRSGETTSRALVRAYLDRIQAIDRSGPSLAAIIEVNPEAEAIADALDRERHDGRVRGALHGIPILVKDNVDTGDRMLTTAGSLALVGAPAPRDAFLVARLREAGAVLIGKTNLSEWANFRSTHSTSGWSARGGQTKNPYALDRNACGSSSGSGAATAANLCALAVGTETDGSIVCPASACGIVGIKPTLGLVSRSGIIPIAHSQDTAGPMARTVADAAALLTIMAGHDPADAASVGRPAVDYTQFLDARALKGARIGVARKHFGFNDAVERLLQDRLDALKQQGAILVDPADAPTTGQYDDTELDVLLYEFKADIARYLTTRTGLPHRSLADLIRFNDENREREMPWFGQELFTKAEAKGPLTEKAYGKALERNRRLSRAKGIDAVLTEHRLDAIVAPTSGPAWTTDLVNGDHFVGGFSTPAAVAGYPHITVPAGLVHGLPIGLSFFAGAWSEPRLVALAFAFEQATAARRPPPLR